MHYAKVTNTTKETLYGVPPGESRFIGQFKMTEGAQPLDECGVGWALKLYSDKYPDLYLELITGHYS